jgi:group II intron reverse transcriptase/maturase
MAVRSNDGQTWLTKLDRIGELSGNDKDIVFNNLGHIISTDMLLELNRELDEKKAVGIDKVSKSDYERNWDENSRTLLLSIRKGAYKPKPARITEIPKEDGSTRPLAISCFEDKLIQSAVNKILSKIYEPMFLTCSYGFRPGVSCHDALKALMKSANANYDGAIIEIDIRKYFNTIPHSEIIGILSKKISDHKFLKLIEVLITAPTMEGGTISKNTCGCPQGSILSPILANIYLHYVIDEWFESIKQTHMHGKAELVRFADDMVFTFQYMSQAERFYEVLPKRLSKYGLELHEDKSQILVSGSNAAQKATINRNKLKTFNFLGFTCYWGKSRSGKYRLKYTSRKDRFSAKLKGMRTFLMNNLNVRSKNQVLLAVISGIRGWVNYHGISDNKHSIRQFLEKSKYLIYKWLNRRGGRKHITWDMVLRTVKALGFPTKWVTKSMFQYH